LCEEFPFLDSCFPDSAFSSSSRSLNCRAHFRSFSHRARNQVITTAIAKPIFQTVSIAVLFEQRPTLFGCRNNNEAVIRYVVESLHRKKLRLPIHFAAKKIRNDSHLRWFDCQ
jgi:hypothetical protein